MLANKLFVPHKCGHHAFLAVRGDSKPGRSEKTSAEASFDGDGGGESKLEITKDMESMGHQ